MQYVKWLVALASLAALGRLSLMRRAGQVLRAIAVRCGLLVVGTVALSATITTGHAIVFENPAFAAGECSRRIPVDALTGSAFKSGAAGGLAVAPASAQALVTTGGAAVASATVGTVALGAATFLASVYGTCKFLDWVMGDAQRPYETAETWADVTMSDWTACQSLVPSVPTTGMVNDMCRVVTRIDGGTWPSGRVYGTNGTAAHTAGGVTIPVVNRAEPAVYRATQEAGLWITSGIGWCNSWSYSNNCSGGGNTTNSRIVLRYQCANNIGGYCGAHPQTVFAGHSQLNPETGYTLVIDPFPEMNETGWRRYAFTDVDCQTEGQSTTHNWVRAVSESYWEKAPTQRIPVPSCAPGEIATTVRSWRVPTGITCTLGATTCDGSSRWVVSEWVAPASWAQGTGPEWVECMKAGNDCGVPTETTEGVCLWGAHSVAIEFCDPERQAGDDPVTTPKSTGTVVANPWTPDEPATTEWLGEEPSPTTTVPGGGGVTVNVPIDNDGESERRPHTEARAECWPTGWGWFNPASWVLQPTKCALTWAFVPDPEQVQEAWENLQDAAAENVPVAWVYHSYGVITDASDGVTSAVASTRDDCLTVLPDGGELVDSAPGELCVAAIPGAAGWLGTARPWLGVAVWVFWAASMYSLLFRKPVQSSEPEQLSLF